MEDQTDIKIFSEYDNLVEDGVFVVQYNDSYDCDSDERDNATMPTKREEDSGSDTIDHSCVSSADHDDDLNDKTFNDVRDESDDDINMDEFLIRPNTDGQTLPHSSSVGNTSSTSDKHPRSILATTITTQNKTPAQRKPGKHKCDLCPYDRPVSLSALQRHRRIHTGETPYKCPLCVACFKQRGQLKFHLRKHVPEKSDDLLQSLQSESICVSASSDIDIKPDPCPLCVDVYLENKDFIYHIMDFHIGDSKSRDTNAKLEKSLDSERPFLCSLCGATFRKSREYIIHSRRHSGEKSCMCQTCGALFPALSSLTKHMRKHTGEKPYECTTCDKKFSLRRSLKHHEMTHTGVKPVQCTLYEYCCISSKSLTRHMLTHTGEKRYVCSQCDYICNRKDTLTVHMRSHSLEMAYYACTVCEFICKTSSELSRHRKSHTHENRKVCTFCTYSTTRADHFKRHMVMHTNEKSFTCSMCSYSTYRSDKLKAHAKTHKYKP